MIRHGHGIKTFQDHESFLQFRRELRDFLRELGADKTQKAPGQVRSRILNGLLRLPTGSPKARQREAQPGLLLPSLVEEIHGDVVQRFNEEWRLEEALHALSSLAKE